MANNGVLVHCEAADGKMAPIATELLGAGSRLARELGQELSAVLTGSGVAGLAGEAIAYGADKVYVVDEPVLADYLTDAYLLAMDRVIGQAMPAVFLMGQTFTGLDLAPRLAFRLGTAAALDCVALSIAADSGRMLMTKPVYGGNAQVIYSCQTDPQIATVRRKAMAANAKDDSRKGEVINVTAGIDPAAIRTRVLDRKVEAAAGVKLEDARVIVCGGRGIGSAEGFKQLDELAALLRGAVGASRPPCDNGWIPESLQIGLTGKIVSPDLYIAVALSGSSQHLSGCSGSQVIVAINKDPEANIFNVAHYGIVADWKKAVPAFAARARQLVE